MIGLFSANGGRLRGLTLAVLAGASSVMVAGICGWLAPAASAAACPTDSAVFASVGAEQCYTVPAWATSVSVVAVGGRGGGGGSAGGGFGADVRGELSVSPGELLYVEVGGNGSATGAGAFNGGGAPSTAGLGGGGGGGASDVRTCSTTASSCAGGVPDSLHSRLLVAAGGGGAGFDSTGGNAGQPGQITNSGFPCEPTCDGVPGGAGQATVGGTGGAGGNGGGPGGDGGFSAGGAGGAGGGAEGGGGGGGGYYGGGGGGAGNGGNGAGGGGGSSLVPLSSSVSTDATGTPSVTITAPPPPAAQVTPSNLMFDAQPQSTLSTPQTVTITNGGSSALGVTGASFGGADADDFLVGSSTCGGQVQPGQACQLTVRFAPQAQGTRTATLQIQSDDPNSPATVTVTGTGGQLPQGTPGATGPQGPAGAAGPRGKTGPAGKVELIKCRTVVKNNKGHRRKVRECTGRLVSGTVKFTVPGATRAAITRGRLLYANGESIAIGHGRLQLLMTKLRPLTRGRYTLTLRTHNGRRWINRRIAITIG